MSALVAQPALAPAGRAPEPGRRGHLALVGPGYVPPVREARAATPLVRLTRRGRRVLAAAVLVLATTASVSLGAWAGAAAGAAAPAAATTSVSVEPGDTLWSLAAATAEPEQDVRAVIEEIVALNGLRSPDLTVGQQLALPA